MNWCYLSLRNLIPLTSPGLGSLCNPVFRAVSISCDHRFPRKSCRVQAKVKTHRESHCWVPQQCSFSPKFSMGKMSNRAPGKDESTWNCSDGVPKTRSGFSSSGSSRRKSQESELAATRARASRVLCITSVLLAWPECPIIGLLMTCAYH